VLGPLEVLGAAGNVTVSGGRLRTLLAVLLLSPNQSVSAERLAAALLGEDAPAGAVGTVRVHVSRLRRALGEDADRLVTRASGYELRVRPGELDSERFSELVESARRALDTDPAHASALLRDALGLWRGRALADVELNTFVQPEIARLEEQRLLALELKIEADLAAGRAAEVLPELHDLARREPSRERLHGQLMLALYRCGRQTDALDVYRRLRATLIDELGIEPGAELRDLQQAILRHDAALDGPSPPRRARKAARHAPRRVVALMAVGTVAGVVAGMLALGDPERRNTGNAASIGTPTLRARVAEVCDSANAAFRSQRRDNGELRRRLRSARTTAEQRDAILAATNASIARSGHNLARLRALEPPAPFRTLLAATSRAWNANLDTLRAYAVRLDLSRNRRELVDAIVPTSRARPAMERNFVAIQAGLRQLGGEGCKLDLYIPRTVPLPPLKSGGSSGTSPSTSTAPISGATKPQPDVGGNGISGGGEG